MLCQRGGFSWGPLPVFSRLLAVTFVLTSNLHPRVAPHVERRATSRREPPEPFPILSSSSSKSSQNTWMKGPHSTALRTIESHGSGPTTISISIAMRRRFSSSAPDLLAPPCHPSSPSTARRAHQTTRSKCTNLPRSIPFQDNLAPAVFSIQQPP